MQKIVKLWIKWVFTFSVISFFNSCEPDPPLSTNNFPGNKVMSVFIDDPGIVWTGSDSGLISLWNNQWIKHEILQGGEINDITSQVSELNSWLWIATSSGAIRADSKTNTLSNQLIFTKESSGLLDNRISVILSDSLDAVWFATPLGISVLKENNWSSWSDFGDLEIHPVTSMAEGSNGWVFTGTTGLGVGRFKCDSGIDGITGASYYNTNWSGLPSDTILSVYVDENNHQWFGTPDGVAFHAAWETKKEWKVYTVSDGLINNRVQAIMGDRKGKTWFGTAEGVSCFDGKVWKNYTIADGLANSSVNDIAIAGDGTLWFATEGGISSFDGKKWNSFKSE